MKISVLQNQNANYNKSWIFQIFGLLVFGSMYAFFSVTGDTAQDTTMFFWVFMALAVTAYVLMAGQILKNQFGISDGLIVQILIIFLLGHFLPFLLDDVGNVHLFYGDTMEGMWTGTIPGLWNFVLCGCVLTQKEQKLGKGVWVLAVCLALFVNPLQGVILVSLFAVQLFFALTAGILNNHKEKGFWISRAFVKVFIQEHWKTLLWTLAWLAAVLFTVLRSGCAGAGIGNALRLFRSTVLNVTKVYHTGVIVLNFLAAGLALWRYIRTRETGFLYWQAKVLLCMGVTVAAQVLVCALVAQRYLVYPHVMLAWMGWFLLITMSSLAYILKTHPRSGWFLPLLVYMILCETLLDYRSFGEYTLEEIAAFLPGIIG